ncbi:hypothetical protein SHKM778_52560 [Streptomyces sp. KM77-8]|uniref:MvdD-like pre-ATP grasp domain-containing protein n=1 Tax=Streptomyces haneummycinicus TaxID=3074435 RepID=A0AAT9HMX3_9ACTN
MTVLILTGEEDVTADMVVVHLNGSGVPVVRLDPADLTDGVSLSAEYVHGRFRGHLSTGGRLVSIGGLRSVWVRRPGTPAGHAPHPSAWLTEEASQALYGILRGCDARWMNHPDAARQARHKPWQLRLAQHCGLPVPATVITTFPRAAREFAERFPDLVVKPVSGAHPQDPPRAVPTSRVAPDTDFSAVAFGPTLLQRRIAKRADIRLTAVGETLLAARKTVRPDADPEEVDVRFAAPGRRGSRSRSRRAPPTPYAPICAGPNWRTELSTSPRTPTGRGGSWSAISRGSSGSWRWRRDSRSPGRSPSGCPVPFPRSPCSWTRRAARSGDRPAARWSVRPRSGQQGGALPAVARGLRAVEAGAVTGRLRGPHDQLQFPAHAFGFAAHLCGHVALLRDESVVDGGILEHPSTRLSARRPRCGTRLQSLGGRTPEGEFPGTTGYRRDAAEVRRTSDAAG